MNKKTVNLSEFAKVLGADDEKRIQALHEAVVSGIAKSIPMLVEASPADTGLFAQSWQFERKEWGAVLGNIAPHAAIIEYGARPFTPPIGPLLAWAKRVLKDPSQPPDYSSAVWGLAKYTQRKIASEGMKPRNILENAIPQILQNIKEEYESAINKT